jgi:hypothetical protein
MFHLVRGLLIMQTIRQDAPHARLYVLRHPGMVRRLLTEI